MSLHAPLLIEIGCEEIPARMIPGAARELAARVERLLDQAGLARGPSQAWGGPRRLAVRVEQVAGRQDDREELVLGPPARVAFGADGAPTAAAVGFAQKQGVDPTRLERLETDRGSYVGCRKQVPGRSVGQVVSDALPAAVEGMSFPKVMRWGDGRRSWVRPVHWLVALHGSDVLPLELFGVRSGACTEGHRFLGGGPVELPHADRYAAALEAAHVVVDPAERRRLLAAALTGAAAAIGGRPAEDPELLEEVADLVEWPGVVAGAFDAAFLELPRELLVTTLRHHQKCFSVRGDGGEILPHFIAVSNTDRDPAGHVRRGNEWVVGGRLEDARFFWTEDRRQRLADRSAELAKVIVHAKLGSYAQKGERLERLAAQIARRVGLDDEGRRECARAAVLSKNDLVTGTVGEFPELQGRIGGLLLQADGEPAAVWRAVYEHYQPAGPDDAIPATAEGCVVALADKLDTVSGFVGIGAAPTGSRDPFGLRRATSGIFRIVIERSWPLSVSNLFDLAGGSPPSLFDFLLERFQNHLRESGASTNEIHAVLRPRISATDALDWPLADLAARLIAIQAVRQRKDFEHLVDLTKRVDNILTKNAATFDAAIEQSGGFEGFEEQDEAAARLWRKTGDCRARIEELERAGKYPQIVDVLAGFVEPVEEFFARVLVIDAGNPQAMLYRREQLAQLKSVLTRCFDIRELAGQADRRSA